MSCSKSVNNESHACPRRRGQMVLIMALGMVSFLGFAGLVVDGGMVYLEKRRLQHAADAGALAGAWEVRRGHTDMESEIRPRVLHDTALNGYGDDNATITVNRPPASGPNQSGDFVEVIIDREVPTTLMRVLAFTGVNVKARAVAGRVPFVEACLLALNRTESAALRMRGTARVITRECGAFSNSTASNGFQVEGEIDAVLDSAGVSGGHSIQGSASITPTPTENMPPLLDPLDFLEPPEWAGWPSAFYDAAAQTYRCPGGQCVFDTRLEVAGPPGVKTFEPGAYVLRDGMDIKSTNVVTGQEVTFYNTGEGGGIRIAGEADVTFSAPTSGPYEGVLFYTDRSAPNLLNDIGRGSSNFTWSGAIYFPSQAVSLEGNTIDSSPFGMIVADTVDFAGTNDMTLNGGLDLAPPGIGKIMLTE